ncbi:MAG: hypothetical protein KGN76_14250 [Acidobacteriota bacterium]|nr:hypothetical protein [Acidobacteriota bacterium]
MIFRVRRLFALGLAGLAAMLAGNAAGSPGAGTAPAPRFVALPGGSAGIGFDDLQFSARLDRVLIPAGRTGDLDLLDPATDAVTTIKGFSATGRFAGGHGEGITSVTEDGRWLFVTDRTADRIDVIDAAARKTVASARLASGPDYVRFVAPTHELWVSEPGRDRIEVFRLTGDAPPTPVHESFIPVPGGPESLVIDATHSRAYTHLWAGKSVAIDLKARRIVGTWSNGCRGSRGIALDPAHGWLFAGCAEGKAVVMDLARGGAQIGSLRAGAGVDIIDYSPALRHLYVPGATSATLSILAVSPEGRLSLVATVPAASGSHCVVADTHGHAYVCDPRRGGLIVVPDDPVSPGR